MTNENYNSDLAEIAELCGDKVAEEMLARLPGLHIGIPHHVGEEHVLRRLEPETMETLLAHFNPGERLYIPVKKPRNLAQAALILANEGMSTDEIALEIGCTSRYVRELLKGKQPRIVDDRQSDLFLPDPSKTKSG